MVYLSCPNTIGNLFFHKNPFVGASHELYIQTAGKGNAASAMLHLH